MRCRFHIALLGMLLAHPVHVFSQESAQYMNLLIESIAENQTEEQDYDVLYEILYDLYENPVNINSPEVEKLVRVGLLTNAQINSLKAYIHKYGKLLSVYELMYVEGFNKELILKISPFISFDITESKKSFLSPNFFQYAKHELIFKTRRVLDKQSYFKEINDSVLHASPGSSYLGDPWHVYSRYKLKVADKLQFAFLAEKDPGEAFFMPAVSDSVKHPAAERWQNGFDFYSAHLFIENAAIVRKFVVGDYHLNFGQGLTLWSGFSMGKSLNAINIKKYAQGIRPSSSANENLFFRGGAASIEAGKLLFTGFYSRLKNDANVVSPAISDTAKMVISSLQNSGYHRSINELEDKDAAEITVFGGNISYNHYTWHTGLTFSKTMINAIYLPQQHLYNQFEFKGNENLNMGFDFDVLLGKTNLFGEVARSANDAIAFIGGLTTQLESRLDLSLLYRYYPKDYHNLFSAAFAESSGNCNESGFYAGLASDVYKGVVVSAYVDLFRFPWLSYRVNKPSTGNEYMLQVDVERETYNLNLRYKSTTKMINQKAQEAYFDEVVNFHRQNLRLCFNYILSNRWSGGSRLELSTYNEPDKNSEGFLISQDLKYQSLSNKLSIWFRYSLFDTDSYDSRIYTYENDLLYSFSIPSFSDSGSRIYLLVKYQIIKAVDLRIKYGVTKYFRNNPEKEDGNLKSEVRFQLRVSI